MRLYISIESLRDYEIKRDCFFKGKTNKNWGCKSKSKNKVTATQNFRKWLTFITTKIKNPSQTVLVTISAANSTTTTSLKRTLSAKSTLKNQYSMHQEEK